MFIPNDSEVGIRRLLIGLCSACSIVFNRVDNDFQYPYDDYVAEKAKTLHRTLFVADMHADSLLWRRNLAKENRHGHVDFPRLLKGNVALQVFTVVTIVPAIKWAPYITDVNILKAILQLEPPRTWFSAVQRVLYQAKKLRHDKARFGSRFRIIESKKTLREFLHDREKDAKMIAGILGIEGGHALGGNLHNVERFAKAGFRMMGITHFFDNRLGGSAHGHNKQGITSFGKQALIEMERHHMLIDLAHASPTLIDDVLKMHEEGSLTKPLVVSHTGVMGIAPHKRNISDKHIRGIVRTGGIVCIGYFKPAIPYRHPQTIAETIYYVIDLLNKDGLHGIDHVALGSDFDGAVRTPFDTRGIVLITEELLSPKYGLSEQDIRNVMGGNILRLLMETLPDA
jgi:membrane dipeptidase